MDYTRQMMVSGAVLGLLAMVLGWMRRRGLRKTGQPFRRRLESLERLPLGPQHTLHRVRAGEEELLIACSAAGCAVLERLPAPRLQEVAERTR